MSPKGYISLEDIGNELKDWIVILVPFISANQAVVSYYSETYFHIPSNVLAFIGAFGYFMYSRMKSGEEITPIDIVKEVDILDNSPSV